MFSFVEDKCKKIELIPWSPTLIFPLNYETLNGKTEIIWREAVPQDSCNDYVTYEIQYTSSFSRGYGWRTIANDIPKGITKFIIDFDLIPFTDDGGIRIRARDVHGVYSIWSSSIRPFSVLNHPPNPVFLIYPSRMEIFDDIMSIIWKEPEVSDIDGQVITYSIEITSNYDSNTGWTIVPNAEYLPRGTTSFTVNAPFPATAVTSGIMQLINISGNTWVASGTFGSYISSLTTYRTVTVGGTKTLSATLDRVLIGAGDTIDAGSINISYI
jgi:hypothetical protein